MFCLPKHTLVGKQNTTWVSAQRPAALLARAGFPDATLATMSSNQALPASAWPRLAVGGAMPSAIESYSQWTVARVRVRVRVS